MDYKRKIFGYECDVYGHLNNANYLHLYEEARAEFLSQSEMSVKDLRTLGYHIYLVRIELDFFKAIPVEENVVIKSEVETMNRLKGVWKQEIFDSRNELCNRAMVTGVFIKDAKPVRLPSELYERFINK